MGHRHGKGDVRMPEKIVRVEALDEQSQRISVELENGSIVVLELTTKLDDPLFAQIRDLSRPRTDGDRVYWANGASLTLDEILELLTSETSG
jgi:hypothetical protein